MQGFVLSIRLLTENTGREIQDVFNQFGVKKVNGVLCGKPFFV